MAQHFKCLHPVFLSLSLIFVRARHRRILLEKVADSARKAVKLAEPYKPYGGLFLEFYSISLSTYQTCMKLTRKVPISANFSASITRGQTSVPLTNERVIFLTSGLTGTL